MSLLEINLSDPKVLESYRQFMSELDRITRRDPLMNWIVRCDDHRRITGRKLTFKTNRKHGKSR